MTCIKESYRIREYATIMGLFSSEELSPYNDMAWNIQNQRRLASYAWNKDGWASSSLLHQWDAVFKRRGYKQQQVVLNNSDINMYFPLIELYISLIFKIEYKCVPTSLIRLTNFNTSKEKKSSFYIDVENFVPSLFWAVKNVSEERIHSCIGN